MRQRTKRADTLPSSTMPNLELPEDPKTWSSTHLSAYLSSTLRGAGAGEVPDQLTRDTTAFVNYTDTGEDVFSHEDDFDRYLPFLSLVFALSLLLFLFLPSANIWFE